MDDHLVTVTFTRAQANALSWTELTLTNAHCKIGGLLKRAYRTLDEAIEAPLDET